MLNFADISAAEPLVRRRRRDLSDADILKLQPLLWIDPSDHSTLFQDAAGLSPATNALDPVARVGDKSGNGFHLTQTEAGFSPLLQQDGAGRWYLDFDGVNDRLTIASRMGLPADPSLTIVAGMNPVSLTGAVVRSAQIGSGAGLLAVAFGTDRWSWRHDNGNNKFGTVTAGQNTVATFSRAAGDQYSQSRLRLDGVEQVASGNGNPTGLPTDTGEATTIGSSSTGSDAARMHYFSLMIFNRVLTPAETVKIERYVAKKSGVLL